MSIPMWGPDIDHLRDMCQDSSELAQRKHARGHGVPPLWMRVVIVSVALVAVLAVVIALGLVFGAPR